MRIDLLLALTLVSAPAIAQEADDPCILSSANPALAPLRGKISLENDGIDAIVLSSLKMKPKTNSEKKAVLVLANRSKACMQQFIQRESDPIITEALRDLDDEAYSMAGALYRGAISYGEFNTRMLKTSEAAMKAIRLRKADLARAEAQMEARRAEAQRRQTMEREAAAEQQRRCQLALLGMLSGDQAMRNVGAQFAGSCN